MSRSAASAKQVSVKRGESPGSGTRYGRLGLLTAMIIGIFWGGYAVIGRLRSERRAAASAQADDQPTTLTRIHALGRLEPRGTILQLSPRSGNEGATVEQILVREGDDVPAGAVLAHLDNRERRLAALKEAEARLEVAEAKLQQVRTGAKAGDIDAQLASVRLAEEQAKVAKRDLERAQELQLRKAVTSEMLDMRQWELDRLILEQRRAAGILESLQEIREVDVRVAEKEVAASKAAVVRAKADAEACELIAPVAGRVLRIHTYPGERISDSGILELGDVRHMQAVAEVFEADVVRLCVGMKAEVKIDASEMRLSGTVAQIGNLVARKAVLTNDPVSDTDARVVEVRIQLNEDFEENVARLSNARVEISILLDSAGKNAADKNSATSPASPASLQDFGTLKHDDQNRKYLIP